MFVRNVFLVVVLCLGLSGCFSLGLGQNDSVSAEESVLALGFRHEVLNSDGSTRSLREPWFFVETSVGEFSPAFRCVGRPGDKPVTWVYFLNVPAGPVELQKFKYNNDAGKFEFPSKITVTAEPGRLMNVGTAHFRNKSVSKSGMFLFEVKIDQSLTNEELRSVVTGGNCFKDSNVKDLPVVSSTIGGQ